MHAKVPSVSPAGSRLSANLASFETLRLYAAGSLAPRSTWPPYVSQPPSEMADTMRPERPRNRYSILGRSSGFDMMASFVIISSETDTGRVLIMGLHRPL